MTDDEVFDRETLTPSRAQGCDVDVYCPMPVSRLHEAAVLTTGGVPVSAYPFCDQTQIVMPSSS